MKVRVVRSLAHYSLCYDTVLFPFDVARLVPLLPNLGYLLVDEVKTMPLAGGTLSIQGVVARRLDTALHISSERRTIAVVAPSTTESLDGLTQIETLLRDELGIDSRQMAAFYELTADVHIEATKSPLEAWQRHLAEAPIITGLSAALGTSVSAYGLRIAPSSSVPNERDWLDIRIEPQVLSPHSLHHINVVFRDQQPDKVEGFTRGFEEMVERLVTLVEG